jgi:hypothetical protein
MKRTIGARNTEHTSLNCLLWCHRHHWSICGSQRSSGGRLTSILAHGAIRFVLERLDDPARRLDRTYICCARDRARSPVRNDRQNRAEDGSNPVNPVVGWDAAIDNGRSKSARWVDAGCRKSCVSKGQNYDGGFRQDIVDLPPVKRTPAKWPTKRARPIPIGAMNVA